MIRVSVPATSGNLGPGFDCLGLALNLRNTLTVFPAEVFSLTVSGEGAARIGQGKDNLCYRAFAAFFEKRGLETPTVRMEQHNGIPACGGLGGSATAILAGLMAAQEWLERPLDTQGLLECATQLEGHPDNVAPALLGGLTACGMEGDRVHVVRREPHPALRYALAAPDFALDTHQARAALPDAYPRATAAENLSRAVMMHDALINGDADTLRYASRDLLHQPYRRGLIPGYDAVEAAAYQSGGDAVVLSGAGPSILCIYTQEGVAARWQESLEEIRGWKVWDLRCDLEGARVERG